MKSCLLFVVLLSIAVAEPNFRFKREDGAGDETTPDSGENKDHGPYTSHEYVITMLVLVGKTYDSRNAIQAFREQASSVLLADTVDENKLEEIGQEWGKMTDNVMKTIHTIAWVAADTLLKLFYGANNLVEFNNCNKLANFAEQYDSANPAPYVNKMKGAILEDLECLQETRLVIQDYASKLNETKQKEVVTDKEALELVLDLFTTVFKAKQATTNVTDSMKIATHPPNSQGSTTEKRIVSLLKRLLDRRSKRQGSAQPSTEGTEEKSSEEKSSEENSSEEKSSEEKSSEEKENWNEVFKFEQFEDIMRGAFKRAFGIFEQMNRVETSVREQQSTDIKTWESEFDAWNSETEKMGESANELGGSILFLIHKLLGNLDTGKFVEHTNCGNYNNLDMTLDTSDTSAYFNHMGANVEVDLLCFERLFDGIVDRLGFELQSLQKEAVSEDRAFELGKYLLLQFRGLFSNAHRFAAAVENFVSRLGPDDGSSNDNGGAQERALHRLAKELQVLMDKHQIR